MRSPPAAEPEGLAASFRAKGLRDQGFEVRVLAVGVLQKRLMDFWVDFAVKTTVKNRRENRGELSVNFG